jgi:hypothetical protein
MTPIISRNDEASRDDRLVSAKKNAVTSILDLPNQCREVLLATVSEFGFDGPQQWFVIL